MAAPPIVILGSGGFGREVLMVLRDIAAQGAGAPEFLGFMGRDLPTPGILERLDAAFIGSPDDEQALEELPKNCQFLTAIGSGTIRERYRNLLRHREMYETLLVHPSAIIGEDVEIASGVVCAGSIITTNVRLGQSTQINLNCTIGHDVVFGDDVTLSPGVNISGNVRVGSRATIYSNATVVPGINVGEGAVVGAGAVVIRDVPPGATVVGNPAREVSRR